MTQKKILNYAGPSITLDDAKAVYDAVLNGFYENYRFHATTLESELSKLIGVDYVIATNSCTASLHLALASLNIGPGDEVITTDSSCVASALPISYVGARGVFVDIDPNTWCISPKSFRDAITPLTKAVIVVHWNGHPAALSEILHIANQHGIHVIEDAAAALGSFYQGKHVGSFGTIGCFSFQGAKIAIGGQGGAFVTNDQSIYQLAKTLSSYGRTDSHCPYWSDYVGWNYLMPNLPAALISSQLKRLDKLISFKRQLACWYSEYLDSSPSVRFIHEGALSRSSYCYPSIEIMKTSSRSRNDIVRELNALGIDARNAQPRISKMPMFECLNQNPCSQNVEDYGIILPGAFNLTQQDIKAISTAVLELAS